MDKQKEIERMADVKRIARILCEDDNGESVHDEITCGNYIECAFTIKAQRLLDEGYGDVKQAQREVLGKLVVKISERSAEIKTLEGKYLRADDIDTAVRFNTRLQEINQVLAYINELVKEVCGE